MSDIAKAIALLRAAGYRVSKPRPKAKDRVGPTFAAEFADGEVTRMSIFTSLADLDIGRGVRLSRIAYETRARQRERDAVAAEAVDRPPPAPRLPFFPPPIVRGRFEQDGKLLASYEAKQLAT